MTTTLTKQTILNDFNKENYEVLDIEVRYSISHSIVFYKCPVGHKHKIIYTNWRHKGTRCAFCAGNARLNLDYVRKEFEREDYILLTEKYKNNSQSLDFICPNGHSHSIRYDKWVAGHRCRKCYNLRQSVELCGSNNNAWRGGKSFEPYCADWTKEYKNYIKERDGYRCLNPYCSGISERLNVHHIDYNKKNCKSNNLITLCVSCNAKANFDRRWHTKWYEAIIDRRYEK